ncbi:hypothetical protein DJ028_07545 [Pseudomonas veronii]|nr:hypothetical protein DXV65_26770 [Pseudomonas fluorescens]RWA28586.1 hypothetical protein DJ028_07545 [Pseudomonas veronii]
MCITRPPTRSIATSSPGCSTSKVELYYGFLVSKWLTARPNIQYVVSPGVNDVDNAWIAG